MPTPVHRTLLALDIEGSGHPSRDNAAVVDSRRALFSALRGAVEFSGIPWADCDRETAGDEVVLIVPPEVPKPSVVHPLLGHLADSLALHNRAAAANRRLRVRAAVHAGELLVDDHGTTGRPQTHLARLLGSRPLREALASAPATATVALLVSDPFFRDVVDQGHRGIDPDAFTPVAVAEKETEARAWLHVVGHVGARAATKPAAERAPADAPAPVGIAFSNSQVEVHGDVFGGNKYS